MFPVWGCLASPAFCFRFGARHGVSCDIVVALLTDRRFPLSREVRGWRL